MSLVLTATGAISLFSARTRYAEAPNAITSLTQALIRRGIEVLDLTAGNPTHVGLGFDHAILNAAFVHPDNARYEPEPFGLRTTRLTLSEGFARDGFGIPPDDILLTASTSEAYGYLFKLLCDPGDRVLVPTPSYPLFDVLAELEGVTLVPYRLLYDGEWHIDQSLVALARSSGARAIFVVHPNNPTGSFLKRRELEILAQTGLPIVSDEVFAEYAFVPDSQRAVSALELSEQLVFRMGGASKSLALPQLKLAWTAMVGPRALVSEARRRLEHIADSYLSPSTPAQNALPALLTHGSGMRDLIRARCRENMASLREVFNRDTPLSVLHTEGGWYAIVRLPALMEEEAWVLALLERDHVHVQPGYFFDLTGGEHIVLSLITEPTIFRRGLTRIEGRVRATMT